MQMIGQQSLLVTEAQIITPLSEILENVAQKHEYIKPTAEPLSQKISQSLNNLFPEQQYDEKDIQKAKEVLGELAKELSADQLKDAVTEIQYLCESWLDDYERKIFKGLTLQEMLHEKGSK